MADPMTLSLRTPVTPERLLELIRAEAPHMLVEPPPSGPEPLLTPSQVAVIFHVDPKTVTRWAQAGRISSVRTLGGHRRYRQSEVDALIAASAQPAVTS